MALVCCFMVCLAALSEINGKWHGEVTGPDGKDYVLKYVFKLDGDKLTGTGQADADPLTITDGKVSGNDIAFSVTIENGDPVKHSGKYFADGDSISMNIDHDGAKMHVTLKRGEK